MKLQQTKNYKILLPISLLNELDYKSDLSLNPGDYVLVPFRSKEMIGVVWQESPAEIDPSKVKSIKSKLDDIVPLQTNFMKFIDWFSNYNLVPKGATLKLALPSQSFFKTGRKRIEASKFDFSNFPELSPEQEVVAQAIIANIEQHNHSVNVIEGITGSGKTEVYLKLARHILENTDKQVLILQPEIALTTSQVMRIEKNFGARPCIWHSNVTEASKREIWKSVALGHERLIIGARSALFLPFAKLGLVVIDEEHEGSYKQEDHPIYHARDMGIARCFFENIPITLLSATPSIETLVNSQTGKYNKWQLNFRYSGSELPEVKLIDMRQRSSNSNFISPLIMQQIAKAKAANQQAMLFLNRRGYAPLTLCKSCGYRFTCDSCSSWLVDHKSNNTLSCHHCGYNKARPSCCPECGSAEEFVPCGPGVERIEEELKAAFPNIRSIIITRDTVDCADKAEAAIASINNHEVDVIIGTQMIAKGHHFPRLNFVGVIDGDLALSGGDLRASEKSFQLLHQVGGRAGREGEGVVYIQTFNPDNFLMQALKNRDFTEFAEQEIANRQAASAPPFSRMAAIIIQSHIEEVAASTAALLARSVPKSEKIEILGPVPALIYKLRRNYRYRLLLKSDKNINLSKFIKSWLATIKIPSTVHVKVDIDPYSFV